MSGVELAGRVLGLYPPLIGSLEARFEKQKTSSITRRSLQLDLEAGYQKFMLWQQTWLSQMNQTDEGSKALWGPQGWENIQEILIDIDRQTQKAYQDIKLRVDSESRSKWKLALVKLKKRQEPSLSELKNHIKDINLAIDRLWLCSETMFDSLHGVLAARPRLPLRELLLRTALLSRIGSLELYKFCCNDSADCILDLDLRPEPNFKSHESKDEEDSHLFYQLFAVNRGDDTQLRKLVVENVAETTTPRAKSLEVVDAGDSEFQLFKIDAHKNGIMVPIKTDGPTSSSCLRIETPTLESIQLQSEPKTLLRILQRTKEKSLPSSGEHFSIGAKIELAYKIVESGFFLLGTPWFSLLKSHTLLRLKQPGQRATFALQVQTFGLVDLLFDDSEALSETKQLLDIGLLLMEIALDDSDVSHCIDDDSSPTSLQSKLALVECTMGAQYCKATAFCLQHRQPEPQFNGLVKYKKPYSEGWENYLSNLLQDYYSQVFLRLEELREIDPKSEYRSRKSWSIE